jgi:hypothetical protein
MATGAAAGPAVQTDYYIGPARGSEGRLRLVRAARAEMGGRMAWRNQN